MAGPSRYTRPNAATGPTAGTVTEIVSRPSKCAPAAGAGTSEGVTMTDERRLRRLCANILFPVSLFSTDTAFYSPSFTSRM